MRLFRQQELGEWDEVITRMTAGLREKVAEGADGASVIPRLTRIGDELKQVDEILTRIEQDLRQCDDETDGAVKERLDQSLQQTKTAQAVYRS